LNGDGFGDVLIAAPGTSAGQYYPETWVFLGSSSGLALQAFWAYADFGRSVGAGDFNGDGFSDALLSSTEPSSHGVVHVLYGGGSEGELRLSRQRLGGPIALYGKSPSEHDFKLKAMGRSPAGRERVRLEWEVDHIRQLFDGTDVHSAATYADTGAPVPGEDSVIELTEVVDGLTAGMPYHWRLRVVSRNPFFPRTPWMSLPGNSITETKLRTSGSGGVFTFRK
jgi:hypothetical protein